MGCQICDGELVLLGCLGNVVYARCRNCGMDQVITDHAEEVVELDDELLDLEPVSLPEDGSVF